MNGDPEMSSISSITSDTIDGGTIILAQLDRFCRIHPGQVYIPEALAFMIFAALFIGLVLVVSLLVAVYTICRKFEFSRLVSACLSIFLLLITALSGVGILAWNSRRSFSGPSEFEQIPEVEVYERIVEEEMQGLGHR